MVASHNMIRTRSWRRLIQESVLRQVLVAPQAVLRQVQPQRPQRRRRIVRIGVALFIRGELGQDQRRLQPFRLRPRPRRRLRTEPSSFSASTAIRGRSEIPRRP